MKNILIFAIGAASGVLGSMYFFKKKYEQIAEEEVTKAKEVYKKKYEPKIKFEPDRAFTFEIKTKNSELEPDDSDPIKDLRTEYNNLAKTYKKEDETDMVRPYIIDQSEYGENDDYKIVSLTYYLDEQLEDAKGELIEDIDYYIGWDKLTDLQEDDVIYVRNDELKTDFEIVKADFNYYEN